MDLSSFEEQLAPDVVWMGLWPGELCHNRDEVLAMLERGRAKRIGAQPEIVLERGESFVVDPHLDGRHHVITLNNGLVSEVRAYETRDAAMHALEGRPW
ncbi:MAG TPA: hypothetical protein VKR23_05350 [Gaiellaceae bacterium]|nr:hypothetical protein [Gaiellaceae bacterium]